jgi:hypothetical protein
VVTPLPAIDANQVAQFWKRFLAAGVVGPSTPVPETVGPFGDSVAFAIAQSRGYVAVPPFTTP